eukprot:COSAG06_NODE_4685_length_4037_cov_1.889030_6_plen_86_part_00
MFNSADAAMIENRFCCQLNDLKFYRTDRWYICENPNGPSRKHSWADACGQITEATALAYNAGKESMLRQLVRKRLLLAPILMISC